jgi:hypothetical protein
MLVMSPREALSGQAARSGPALATAPSPTGDRLRQWANGRVAARGQRRQNSAMRMSEAIGGAETWARWLSWATVGGVVLGVAGPFGSYFNGGAVARIAFWTALLWVGAVVLGLTVAPALRLSSGRKVPLSFVAGVATVVACAPLALAVALIGRAVWGRHAADLTALDWYAQTLFVSAPAVAGALWFETRGRAGRRPAPAVAAAADGAPRRLSARQRAEALCLQMEDHYVRVHTPGRAELVLLPLHQAITELGDVEGLRVHRSWWVARRAVRRTERDGRSVQLVLINGFQVPVARNRVAELKAAGWLTTPGDEVPER